MNSGISQEQIRANMRHNLSYAIHRARLSLTELSERSGVSAAILYKWAQDPNYSGPSFRSILSVLQVLGICLNDFCYAEMSENAFHRRDYPAVARDNLEAKFLILFQELPEFDQETVIRVMTALHGGSDASPDVS